MSEQSTRAPFRPRVWWSPTQGVIEQVEPHWPGEEMRVVRTRDRWVVQVSDDAVELAAIAAMPPQGVTAEQVRHLLVDAYLRGRDDERDGIDPKDGDELYYAVRTGDARSAEYLAALGIPVQDGEQQ
jgi:hypothetical protein